MIVDRYYFQQHRMVWAVVGFFCGCLLVWVRQPLGWLAICGGKLYFADKELVLWVARIFCGFCCYFL